LLLSGRLYWLGLAGGKEISGWRSYAALCALALAAYGNSLGLGMTLDAHGLIEDDARVHAATAANLKLIATTHYWFPHAQDRLYRPVTTLSFLFNYAVLGNGAHPFGYHALNLLLHLGNVLLVLALARRALGGGAAAFCAAAIWAVHPVTTESVANLAGRADLLAAMAVLGGVLWYVSGRGSPLALFPIAAAGFASKESTVVLPAMMLLWDWSFGPRKQGRAAAYAAVLAGLAVVWFMRERVFAAMPLPEMPLVDNPLRSMGFWTARLTAVKALGSSLALLVWPANLAFDHSYNQLPPASWRDPWVWVTIAAVTELIAVAALRRQRDPLPFFAAGWCGLALLPTANLVVLIGSPMAVRFLYLASAGFAIAAAALAFRLPDRRLAWGLMTAAVLAMAVRTAARNPAWASDLALASADAPRVPRSFRAHALLASSLMRQDPEANLDRALDEAQAAWAILQPLPPERNDDRVPEQISLLARSKAAQMGGAATAAGRAWLERSLEMAQRAAEVADARTRAFAESQRAHGRQPPPRAGYEDVYLNLGMSYAALGRDQDALAAYRMARVEEPRLREAYDGAIAIYERRNDPDGAAAMVLEKAMVLGLTRDTLAALTTAFRGCALARVGNTVQVNYACPAVARSLCAAAADAESVFREGRRDANARQVAAIAAGCAR